MHCAGFCRLQPIENVFTHGIIQHYAQATFVRVYTLITLYQFPRQKSREIFDTGVQLFVLMQFLHIFSAQKDSDDHRFRIHPAKPRFLSQTDKTPSPVTRKRGRFCFFPERDYLCLMALKHSVQYTGLSFFGSKGTSASLPHPAHTAEKRFLVGFAALFFASRHALHLDGALLKPLSA